MNQKIFFLFLSCLLFTNQIWSMSKTTQKLAPLTKSPKFIKLKKLLLPYDSTTHPFFSVELLSQGNAIPLNPYFNVHNYSLKLPKKEFDELKNNFKNHFKILQNHEKFIDWYNNLPWQQKNELFSLVRNYMSDIYEYFANFHDMSKKLSEKNTTELINMSQKYSIDLHNLEKSMQEIAISNPKKFPIKSLRSADLIFPNHPIIKPEFNELSEQKVRELNHYRNVYKFVSNLLDNHFKILQNHKDFLRWYNQLSEQKQKKISPLISNYISKINNYFEKFKNIDDLSPYDENTPDHPNDFIYIRDSIQEELSSTKDDHALRPTPERIALQHFQNTKAPYNTSVKLFVDDYSDGGTLAEYFSNSQNIHLYKLFKTFSPSSQYHILIHEYRHHLQNLNNAISDSSKHHKFYSPTIREKGKSKDILIWHIYEHDAETFATEHIFCPTCLKIIQLEHEAKFTTTSLGYFSKEDFEPFVQAAEHNECCPAHTKTPGDDQHNLIVEKLQKKLTEWPEQRKLFFPDIFLEKIGELDKKSGNLLAHIPNYNRDFIRKIAEQKEFQELLGAKLLKELDVRNTMAKTETLAQKGEFPLLEESKLSGIAPEKKKSSIDNTLKAQYEKPLIPEEKITDLIPLKS